MLHCREESTSRSLYPVPQTQRQKKSSMYSIFPQDISSMGRQITSSQVEVNHSPFTSLRSRSLIWRQRSILKERRCDIFWGTSLYKFFVFSYSEQGLDHPSLMKLSQTQYSREMEYATAGFLLWQIALNTLNTFLPTNSSSPSTKNPISLDLQCLVMAMCILGTAVICFLLVMSTTLLANFLLRFRKCLIRAEVLSEEASSTMTTRQLLQSWLKMDCRLYSYLKFLALLKLGTTMQKGSSVLQSLQWQIYYNLVYYFFNSYSICFFSRESMKGVLILARQSIHGFRFFSGLKYQPFTSSSNFVFLVCLMISLALFSSKSSITLCSSMIFYRSSILSVSVISDFGFPPTVFLMLSPSCTCLSSSFNLLLSLENNSILVSSSWAFSLVIFFSMLPTQEESSLILSRVSVKRTLKLALFFSMLKSLIPRRMISVNAIIKAIVWTLFLVLEFERSWSPPGLSNLRKFIALIISNSPKYLKRM